MDEAKPEEIYLSVNDIEICCFRWGDTVGRTLLLPQIPKILKIATKNMLERKDIG